MTEERDVSVPTTPTNPDDRREQVRADVRETALAVVKALYPSAVGEVLRGFRESDVASISAAALKAREGRKRRRLHDLRDLIADELGRHLPSATTGAEANVHEALYFGLVSVVAPVLEGLCRTATEEQKRGDALYEERDKYIRLFMDEQEKVAALSSLLRGMARRATKLRRGMRGHEARIAHLVSRPSVSDQTPATPDDACPKRGDSHCLHYQEGDGSCCACKKLPCLCPDVPQDECPRHESAAAPSSVQGDTTPEEA